MNAEHPRKNLFSLKDISPLYIAGTGILATIKGEQTIGRIKRKQLRREIDETLEDPEFGGGKEGKSYEAFMKKLDQITPRRIGALSLYSAFSEQSYNEVAKTEGLECFYLFWGLGEEQDDLIDVPKKQGKDRQISLNEIIFKDGFLRGARHLLEEKITHGKMGDEEKRYLKEKIAQWYGFLSDQEQKVQSDDFSSFDFSYCMKYREEQNQKAGEVLVALLNWDKCLDPNLQKLEKIIPKFSILTQMVDDIGDTVEDIEAQRPSFAIGALRNNPAEFEKFLDEVKKKGIKKVHPSVFREFAPQSYILLREHFRRYCLSSEAQSGIKAKGFNQIANLVFHFFPSVRDFLFKLSPEIANF